MSDERTQLIFINSAERIYGTPYDFNIVFPDELIRADHKTRIKLIVIDACINRSYYTVDTSNDTFSIHSTSGTTTPYIIPIGYYDVYTFKSQLLSLLPSGWSINFNTSTNTYQFQPPNDTFTYNFTTFTNNVSQLLGFPLNSPSATFSFSSPLTSSQPVKMNRENAVFIHCDIPKSEFASVDNFSGSFEESDVICKLPMNCAPFDNLVYISQGNDSFSFLLSVGNLNNARFYLTDETGRLLHVVYDWTITLKMVYETGDDNALLLKTNEIADYLQLMVLNKHMK